MIRMILSVDEAKKLIGFNGWSDERIERKLKSIEQTIRSYTNNSFQNRCIRAETMVDNNLLYAANGILGLITGDTVQLSESMYNNGLYVVKDIEDNRITLDGDLTNEEHVLLTKVVYPDDVIDCCINLCEWEVKNRGKVGVKSETLSRHSVTYFDQDVNNQVNGYPVSLLGCLKPYRKARC